MVHKTYQLNINIRLTEQTSGHGDPWAPGSALNQSFTITAGRVDEVLGILGAFQGTIEQITEQNKVLTEIRSQTGKEPCNCRGDGLHVHVADVAELAAIDQTGGRWVKVDQDGAAADATCAAEAAGPAGRRVRCQCGERCQFARFDETSNGNLYICPNGHEVLTPRFAEDEPAGLAEPASATVPTTAVIDQAGNDTGASLIGRALVAPGSAPIPR